MTGGAASSSLPGPAGVSAVVPVHPSRGFPPVTQSGFPPNASARIMIPLARGPSGLAGRRRRWRQW